MLLYLFFGMLRPMLKKISPQPVSALTNEAGNTLALGGETNEDGSVVKLSTANAFTPKQPTYQENLEAAKALAKQDPRIVANIVKNWVDGNE